MRLAYGICLMKKTCGTCDDDDDYDVILRKYHFNKTRDVWLCNISKDIFSSFIVCTGLAICEKSPSTSNFDANVVHKVHSTRMQIGIKSKKRS